MSNDIISLSDTWKSSRVATQDFVESDEFDRIAEVLARFEQEVNNGGKSYVPDADTLSQVAYAGFILREGRLRLEKSLISFPDAAEKMICHMLEPILKRNNNPNATYVWNGLNIKITRTTASWLGKSPKASPTDFARLVLSETILLNWIRFMDPEYELCEITPVREQAQALEHVHFKTARECQVALGTFFYGICYGNDVELCNNPLWDITYSLENKLEPFAAYFEQRGQKHLVENLVITIEGKTTTTIRKDNPAKKKGTKK